MTASPKQYFQHLAKSAGEQLHQAIANLCPPHFPVEDSEQLTILLIQSLAQSLDSEYIADFWARCQSYGEAVDTTTIELSGLSSSTLKLPTRISTPCFVAGTNVRWKPLTDDPDETDTGTIVGSFYAPAQSGWNWKYLVLLDRTSYSRQFCIADTAWEADLARAT